MTQFSAYSQYYDLLYRDKDYVGEADYVRRLLNRYLPDSQTILELGCGTGRHAALLAAAGLAVTGVEVSPTMLTQSVSRSREIQASGNAGRFDAMAGDARNVRVNQIFHAVISLFHVVSYQTTNDDVRGMFETAAVHLRSNGIFLFDVWYGPAVLSLQPAVREKRMENDQIAILRIAEPDLIPNANRVNVTYTVQVTKKSTGQMEQFIEHHHMRYYFAPELERFAEQVGMEIIHSEEWMTAAQPSQTTWGVTFIARRVTPSG